MVADTLKKLKKYYDDNEIPEDELFNKLSKLENANCISDYIFSVVCGVAGGIGFYVLQMIGMLLTPSESGDVNYSLLIVFLLFSVALIFTVMYLMVKRHKEGTMTKFMRDYEIELIKQKINKIIEG